MSFMHTFADSFSQSRLDAFSTVRFVFAISKQILRNIGKWPNTAILGHFSMFWGEFRGCPKFGSISPKSTNISWFQLILVDFETFFRNASWCCDMMIYGHIDSYFDIGTRFWDCKTKLLKHEKTGLYGHKGPFSVFLRWFLHFRRDVPNLGQFRRNQLILVDFN